MPLSTVLVGEDNTANNSEQPDFSYILTDENGNRIYGYPVE